MRVTEAFQTVPTFLLALALLTALGSTTFNVVLAIAISSWAATSRLVRAEVLCSGTVSTWTRRGWPASAPSGYRIPGGIARVAPAGRLPGRHHGGRGDPGRVGARLPGPERSQSDQLGRDDRPDGRDAIRVAPSLLGVIPGVCLALAILWSACWG